MANGFKENFVSVKIFKHIDKGELPELTEDLSYQYGKVRFIIKKGFKTDFASVPRIFWAFLSPFGRHTLPSVLHDWLYINGYYFEISRKEADKIFYDAMIDCGVKRLTANIMWFCVRLFAGRHYKKS